jgi:glycerophosphoryl diester phosphodiesterase
LPDSSTREANRLPLIIGHRGAAAVAPENTIAAFQRAIRDGADGVEFDVRLSGDGAPVVIHDQTLRRTGLSGGAIAKLTASELRQIDAGSWFNRAHPKLARDEYIGQHLPSLDGVIQLFASGGGPFTSAKLYVEMKTDGAQMMAGALASAVVRSILAQNFADRVVVLSFDLCAITEIKRLSSVVRTGALFKPSLAHPLGSIRKELGLLQAANRGIDEIALHHRLVTKGTIALANQYTLPVVVWTLNELKRMARMRALGIHAVITDDPARMKAALDSATRP